MKVTHRSDDRLILDDLPWIRGSLISVVTVYVAAMGFREMNAGRDMGYAILAGAIIIGAAFFALFVVRYQIIFLRDVNQLIKRRRSVFGYKETTYDLASFSHAEVEKSRDSDGGYMYQPVLLARGTSDAKNLYLVGYSTTGFGPPKMVDAINDWLGVAPELDLSPEDP